LLANITEIKENALRMFVERDHPEIIMAEQAMNQTMAEGEGPLTPA